MLCLLNKEIFQKRVYVADEMKWQLKHPTNKQTALTEKAPFYRGFRINHKQKHYP